MKHFLAFVAVILGTLALVTALNAFGMVSWSFFGKWGEQIRYDIHKESQTYRDGMQLNLAALQRDYLGADASGKAAIKATVRHQYSKVSAEQIEEMPAHLKKFLSDMGVY